MRHSLSALSSFFTPFKLVYYWWARVWYMTRDGRHLSKEENVSQGKWIVIYPDGMKSKPCFWDVAFLRSREEPGSVIEYIGPGAELLKLKKL